MMPVKSKEKRIEERKKVYNSIFGAMETDRLSAIQPLIDNACFMAIILEDLQKEILEKGVTDKYQNGANQYGIKKSAEVETYNVMVKNFSTLMKQIIDALATLLPNDTAEKVGEKLAAFNREIEFR